MTAVDARGIILRTDEETLVVQASAVEIARFATGRPVIVTSDVRRQTGVSASIAGGGPDEVYDAGRTALAYWREAMSRDEWLYNRDGVAVARVRAVNVAREMIDTTRRGDEFVTHIPGRLVTITVTADVTLDMR